MIDAILGVLGSIIYPLFSIIFLIIDIVQNIFKAFAGTGNVTIGGKAIGGDGQKIPITSENTGKDTDTGIVYYLLQSEIIKNLFVSILVLALFLIIIFTVMAFIKNAYASKQKKWQEIVGNAFIGLANFIFIPVCCLLGIWLGNILLKAIDGATNISGATSMSGQLFVAAAYNANELRQENTKEYNWDADTMYSEVENLIKKWRDRGVEIDVELEKRTWSTDEEHNEAREYYAGIVDYVYGQDGVYKGWTGTINDWYQLININYVLLAGGGCFVIYALAAISFGMVKRLFTLLMLFVISPAMCALYPLDDGSAVKKWKDDFVRNTISAYGAVVGMNLFFSLAPIIQQINLTGGGNVLDVLGLTSLLLTIAGLYMVKDFISMISGYIGAGNAYADGAGLMGNVTKRVKQGAKWTGKRLSGMTSAFVKASGAMNAASDHKGRTFFGSLWGSAKSGLNDGFKALTGIDVKGGIKGYKDAYKEGEKGQKTEETFAKLKDEADKAAEALAKLKNLGDKDPRKLEAKTKYNEAMDELVAFVEKLGLGDKYKEKAAKELGLEGGVSQYEKEREERKKEKERQRALEQARNEKAIRDQMLDDIARKSGADKKAAIDKFNARFGTDLEMTARAMNKSLSALIRDIQTGVKITDEDINEGAENGSIQNKSAARRLASSFNDTVDVFTQTRQKFQQANEAWIDGALATMKGRVLGEGADAIQLDDKTMQELKEAYLSGSSDEKLKTFIDSYTNSKNRPEVEGRYREAIRAITDIAKEIKSIKKDK